MLYDDVSVIMCLKVQKFKSSNLYGDAALLVLNSQHCRRYAATHLPST